MGTPIPTSANMRFIGSEIPCTYGFSSHKRSFSFKTNSVALQLSTQQFQGFASTTLRTMNFGTYKTYIS